MVLKARRRDELTEGVSVVGKEVFLGNPHGKGEKKCAGEKRFHLVCWVEMPGRPSWGILSRWLESLAVAGEGRAGDANSSSLAKGVQSPGAVGRCRWRPAESIPESPQTLRLVVRVRLISKGCCDGTGVR